MVWLGRHIDSTVCVNMSKKIEKAMAVRGYNTYARCNKTGCTELIHYSLACRLLRTVSRKPEQLVCASLARVEGRTSKTNTELQLTCCESCAPTAIAQIASTFRDKTLKLSCLSSPKLFSRGNLVQSRD